MFTKEFLNKFITGFFNRKDLSSLQATKEDKELLYQNKNLIAKKVDKLISKYGKENLYYIVGKDFYSKVENAIRNSDVYKNAIADGWEEEIFDLYGAYWDKCVNININNDNKIMNISFSNDSDGYSFPRCAIAKDFSIESYIHLIKIIDDDYEEMSIYPNDMPEVINIFKYSETNNLDTFIKTLRTFTIY